MRAETWRSKSSKLVFKVNSLSRIWSRCKGEERFEVEWQDLGADFPETPSRSGEVYTCTLKFIACTCTSTLSAPDYNSIFLLISPLWSRLRWFIRTH